MHFKKWIMAALFAVGVMAGVSLASTSHAMTNPVVMADGVNMREQADIYSEVVAVVDRNCPIQMLGEQEDWYLIQTYGKQGYVKKEYLQEAGTQTAGSTEDTTIENRVLKAGTRSAQVSKLQGQLKELGYFVDEQTGYFGQKTENAVKEFQDGNNLEQDGVVGQAVRGLLDAGSGIHKKDVQPKVTMVEVQKKTWAEMQKIYSKGTTATAIDVQTGRRFNVKHLYGTNHADSEPLSAQDTATMKSMYGGSWSWNRRPIILLIDGQAYAASMNGMPHGGQSISNNGFNGHFCIHFVNSRTHGGNRVCPQHQAAINSAAAVGSIAL